MSPAREVLPPEMVAVAFCRGRVHDGIVGKKGRRGPGVVLCLLIPIGGAAGCVYEYPEPAHTPAPVPEPASTPSAGPAPPAGTTQPYGDPRVLGWEARNYAALQRQLGVAPGQVILSETGPLDGPLRGFGSMEEVPEAGHYTVTAACVGASGARISVGQEHPGAPFRPTELDLDCATVTSQVIALEPGYVFAHLVLPAPGDTPRTGAVGGVRVSRNR